MSLLQTPISMDHFQMYLENFCRIGERILNVFHEYSPGSIDVLLLQETQQPLVVCNLVNGLEEEFSAIHPQLGIVRQGLSTTQLNANTLFLLMYTSLRAQIF